MIRPIAHFVEPIKKVVQNIYLNSYLKRVKVHNIRSLGFISTFLLLVRASFEVVNVKKKSVSLGKS